MNVVPVIHPAATFRNPGSLGPLTAHVENFLYRVVKGRDPDPELKANPPASALKRLYQLALKYRYPVAVDVECSAFGLLPGFAQLSAIGVGIAHGPGLGLSWTWEPGSEVRKWLRRLFLDPRITKLFQNGWSYDIPVLTRYGYKFAGPIEDTRDLRHALSSTSRVALAAMAAMYLRCGAWKAKVLVEDEDDKGYVDPRKVKRKQLLLYNAEDTVRTAQIRKCEEDDLRNSGADRARVQRIYEQQLRLAQVASQMHLKGFPFDRAKQKELRANLLAIYKRESFAFKKLVAKRAPFFRVNSSGGINDADLAALIYKDCSRPGIKTFGLQVPLAEVCWTESGKPAVNRDALLHLFSLDHTPTELKLIIRQGWKVDGPLKLKSTYVDSELVERSIGPDNRMHAKVNSAGPETYRWSCSKPNLFNLPEQKELDEGSLVGTLPNMRSMYVAPKGHVIVHRDFKQLELEVMAEYTGDVTLRRMLDTGDAHTARVQEWFGVPVGQPVPKQLRKLGKMVGFGSQYGAGVETVYLLVLEQNPDALFDDVFNLHTLFPEKHSSIKAHWETSVLFAQQYGYSEAPIMGYRRAYPPGFPLKPTETSNYAIQAGAAAIANCVMVGKEAADAKKGLFFKLQREYPDAWLAMHVYDSFDVICREKDAKGVGELMDECMSGPWLIGSRLKKYGSDLKVGTRWSEV